jgi:hypothetical protein
VNRNRNLLDLAHEVPQCMNCERSTPDGCDPAHENGIAAGKGQSIKGQDNRHAALCNPCHRWYDSGSVRSPCGLYAPTKADKAEMWNRAHKRTYDWYWSHGWLKVSA